MKKLANHIILSGVTVSMLFSPLMAIDPNKLPSGGKFTHGTSGSISGPYFDKITGKNTIDITGKTPGNNHVIQWGGGFSIGNKAQVNFKGDGQHNYLNIAHGTDKSTIEGVLNAGGNNVFLINPNGVIIEKSGSIINANRFVASTTSLQSQHFEEFKAQGAAFSPVFKPQKAGNVVNMGGEINAASVVLQGNKVVSNAYADYDKNLGEHSKQISANEITLQGNEVYVDVSSINGNKLGKLNIKGSNGNNFEGSMYLNASGYYYNPNSFKVFDKYTNTNNNFKVYKYVGIGSDVDWWHFAKGWNENKDGVFRNIASEYRLTSDIDFKGNQGKGVEGKDWKNYANYCIDGLGCTSMIVGRTYDSAFTKTFDGQGFTLKNINIDTTILDNKPIYVGLFGRAEDDANFKNINVDYKQGNVINIALWEGISGGFVGAILNSKVSNITIKNINKIYGGTYAGGFAGTARVTAKDIAIENINTIKGSLAGGFSGEYIGDRNSGFSFERISLRKIKEINGENYAGGFMGYMGAAKATFCDISLDEITNIYGTYAGGFAGMIDGRENKFDNIYIDNISYIKGGHVAGFSNLLFNHDINDFNNIFIFFNTGSKLEGVTEAYIFTNLPQNNNNSFIYYDKNDLSNAILKGKVSIIKYDEKDYKTNREAFLKQKDNIKKPIPPTKPDNPTIPNNVVVSKPSQNTDYIPNTEDIINEKVVLDENDLYKDIII
ncbi:filamentous hemagglutinin N-terminal domain-containing protein, partial [Campylobacter lari]|uniref:filamentous hemagglutinin N-terminal domain-containing protein n=1 Tax=Campylobacter lari TaxID=201 RepID=UPI001BD9E2F9